MSMTTREILDFLFENPSDPAANLMGNWLSESKRFAAFAFENRSKIRKKLRTATTPESLQSVLLELDVARRLVADHRCQVEYERYGQGRLRSPDLTATFRTHTVVNLEVTRVKSPTSPESALDGKLIPIVCHKLG